VDARPTLSLADALTVARPAYDALLEQAEEIEDEWSYVNDLSSAWLARLDDVERDRGGEPVSADILAAIETLVAEAERIDDPHRAIDWLSTFPQVLLVALGERP
jgi:hypothetical protein